MTGEQELIGLSRKLLVAIDTGDWGTYENLCDESLTCFEPEALGNLVEGLPFHQYYFKLPPNPSKQSTIASPHVRLMGDVAVVSYVRVVQRLSGQGNPESVSAMETRVWQKKDGKWKHVHFHRTPC